MELYPLINEISNYKMTTATIAVDRPSNRALICFDNIAPSYFITNYKIFYGTTESRVS